ncbi:MAG: Tim44/TimA family putative adaptor protein [Bdellovibrionales bacterium]
MPADLIVYGLVAAGLVFWLRSILGTRHGEERERPDPFAQNPRDMADHDEKTLPLAADMAPKTPQDAIRNLAEQPTEKLVIANKTAELGLVEIADADKGFDIGFFLEAVQDVFVMVVESFGKGDRETLKDLLGNDVYNAFDQAIAARENTGEVLQNEIHAIRKVEITDAMLDNRTARVTVRFLADETSVTRDKDGEIIAGHPDKTVIMRDVWVFSRDVKSKDPRWFVVETRDDVDGDNETIPNTKTTK